MEENQPPSCPGRPRPIITIPPTAPRRFSPAIMNKRPVILAVTIIGGLLLFGVAAVYQKGEREGARLVLKAKALEPVIPKRLKECFKNPSRENIDRFRTAVVQLRELISDPRCPSEYRHTMELQLGEAVGIARGIIGDSH